MIHMTSLELDQQTPFMQKRLRSTVADAMKSGGRVHSASGMTAVLAVEWCRTNGYGYTLTEGATGHWDVLRGEHR